MLPQYDKYLKQQRQRRGEYIKAALRKSDHPTFNTLAQLHRTTMQKFPGPVK